MKITTKAFGRLSDGTSVTAARMETEAGASVTILDYGATIQSLCVPGRDLAMRDVVLGYDTAEEYEKNDAYLGATIGRVGNRIGGAAFTLNGEHYKLAENDGANHLHGGVRGFDRQMWNMSITMTVYTDMPGMQVYSGNFLTKRAGKGGSTIDRRGALCLETQLYPNGIAYYGFPSPVLHAGEKLHSETIYAFSHTE